MKSIFCSCFLFCFTIGLYTESWASIYPDGEIVDTLVKTVYQGGEKLKYEISWSSGIKIGELQLDVLKVPGKDNVFELRVQVHDSGLFHLFYPVSDSFSTVVEGENWLPVSYEVIQKEGKSYTARRHTEYDQKAGKIRYQKNDKLPIEYSVDGAVHNEFSAFFFTRIMKLEADHPAIVPTFADGKRHEVVVRTGAESRIKKTILGDVNVIRVAPIMKFKGLYDKAGDTVIWFTNDECRIPVRINSKILIGSLTAELVSYSNPQCTDQKKYHIKKTDSSVNQQHLELGD